MSSDFRDPIWNYISAISDRSCPATAPYSHEVPLVQVLSFCKFLYTWGHEGEGWVMMLGSRTRGAWFQYSAWWPGHPDGDTLRSAGVQKKQLLSHGEAASSSIARA